MPYYEILKSPDVLHDSITLKSSYGVSTKPEDISLITSAEKDPKAEDAPSFSYQETKRTLSYTLDFKVLVPTISWDWYYLAYIFIILLDRFKIIFFD